MSLAGSFVLGWLTGVFVFLAIPIVLGTVGLEGVPRKWYDWATTIGGAALLVDHSKGYVLRWASFDEEAKKWEVSISGDTKHFEDPANRMHRLFGVPFGVADSDKGVIIDPRDMAVAELVCRRSKHGDLVDEQREHQQVAADGGGVSDGNYREVVVSWIDGYVAPFDERGGPLVAPRYGSRIISASGVPELTTRTRNLEELAQQFYNETSKWDVVKYLAAFAVPFGLMWMGSKVQSTGVPSPGGGTAPPLPGVVAVDVTPLLDLAAMGVL